LRRTDLIILTAGLLIGAGLAVLIYYGLGLDGVEQPPGELVAGANLPVSPAVGHAAPQFELHNLHNDSFSLVEMRGKIVVLNFWATWCGPCRFEMPLFEKLHNSANPDLEIWGVNFDENPQQVERFIEELKLSFPILLDPGANVQDLYQVRGYPTTFIIDEDGVIRFQHIGLITEAQLTSYLDQLGEIQ
jgi:cytochrome c biogenesis protein CcmG/thiol:disulfide interchange protein DsbE